MDNYSLKEKHCLVGEVYFSAGTLYGQRYADTLVPLPLYFWPGAVFVSMPGDLDYYLK